MSPRNRCTCTMLVYNGLIYSECGVQDIFSFCGGLCKKQLRSTEVLDCLLAKALILLPRNFAVGVESLKWVILFPLVSYILHIN